MTVDRAGHDEIVLFTEKPNALFYALDVARQGLLVGGLVGLISGLPLLGEVVYSGGSLLRTGFILILTFFFSGLFILAAAFFTARHLMFVVTNKRAIVRFSFRQITADGVSVAVETVRSIEINSHGAAYGSIFLNYDKALSRESNKGSEPDYSQPKATQRALNELTKGPVPIKRTALIWGPTTVWPGLLGFYGLKSFDEFANSISEQQKLRLEFLRGR